MASQKLTVRRHQRVPVTEPSRVRAAVRAAVSGADPPDLPGARRESILAVAGDHQVVPLVAGVVSGTTTEDEQRAIAATALRLTGELLDLLAALEEAGIRGLPFKGPALATAIYGDPARRQYEDLDVLVPPEDVPAAVRVLEDRGYRAGIPLSRAELDGVIRHHSSLHYHRDGVTVDLQWRLAPSWYPVDLDVATLYDRAGSVSLQGRRVQTLAPDDRVIALCVHGGKHRWSRLKWIADVAAAVAADDDAGADAAGDDSAPDSRIDEDASDGGIDPDRLLARADGSRSQRRTLLGLALARDVVDATLPPELDWTTRSEPAVEALATEVRDGLFDGEEVSVPSAAVVPFHLRTLDGTADRVRYLARLAFSPGPADVRIAPGGALAPLQYVVRPPRLAVQAVRRRIARR